MAEPIRQLVTEEQGQDLIEYSLLCALLAIACILGLLQLSRIREFFAAAGAALDSAL